MAKRKMKNDLTLEKARELFRYENGKLYWLSKIRFSSHSIGDKVSGKGRLIPTVELNGLRYQLHRIVYLLQVGYCPESIDFIDKALTNEGSYNISFENLFEPPKKEVIRKSKRKYKENLSYFEAKTYFEYSRGRLYWKKRTRFGRMVIGQLAGSKAKDSPFLKVMLHKKSYMQHRIVYLLHHRYCPEIVSIIDKTLTEEGFYDISIENLKATTPSLSKNSTKTKIGNTSKYRGVCYDKESGKYRVRVSINGVRRQFGKFKNEIEAARKYDEMARQLIGEDAVLNFPDENILATSSH